MSARLHYLPISHYCVKARRILDFKGVDYEIVPGPYHDRQHLLAVSGQDYVPYLEWGQEGVTWSRLPDFVEKAVPTPTLYPGGTRELARIVDDWAHAVVEEAVWKYVVSDAPQTFSDPRERWVFEEMQIRRRGPLEIMALRKPEFLEGLKSVLGLIEGPLERQTYLLGSEPSLADFAVYAALSPIWYTGNAIPAEFKRVVAWKERVDGLGERKGPYLPREAA